MTLTPSDPGSEPIDPELEHPIGRAAADALDVPMPALAEA